VSGAMRRVPLSATLFMLGFVAITGSPPFGPFFSEFTIASAAFGGSHLIAGSLFLLLLVAVFIGMGRTVLTVVQGKPSTVGSELHFREGILMGVPLVALCCAVLMLGLYVPRPLADLLHEAVRFLEA